MHIAMHGVFINIAMEHYEKFRDVLKQYNALTNNNQQWDIQKHSSEENKMYFSSFSEKH